DVGARDRDDVGLRRPAGAREGAGERARVGAAAGQDGADGRGAGALGGDVAVDVVGEGGDGEGVGARVGDHHGEGEVTAGRGAGEGAGRLVHRDGGHHVGDPHGGVVGVRDHGAGRVLAGGGDDVGLDRAAVPGEV